MALPSGYTQIDYIEATGTQYFDTGFKPNQNTRVVMDVEVLATTQCAPFGARVTQDSTTYTLFLLTATSGRTDYGTSKQSMTFDSILGRYTIDANKNTTTVNGVAITHTAATFSVDYNLFLCAVNTAGAASNYAKLKLYFCKIYDNGTLVRDFVPCKNTTGALGLWDNVNSKFYANAGTGTFTTGSKHKTLIDGTGYEIKSGRVLIGGTGYDIKKGRTLIDGTGYDIKFGTPVRELPVGSSVYMNVGGVRKEWLVVHQGKPISTPVYYDDTCSGTWLLLKDIYTLIEWAFKNTTEAGGYYLHYEYSKVDKYLRETFFPLLDPHIQSLIKQINLPLISRNSAIYVTPLTIPRQLFLLSRADLGFGYWANETFESLEYFPARASQQKLVGYYNGNATDWNIRDDVDTYYNFISDTGLHVALAPSYATTAKYGVRPALVLPQEDAKFDDSFNII